MGQKSRNKKPKNNPAKHNQALASTTLQGVAPRQKASILGGSSSSVAQPARSFGNSGKIALFENMDYVREDIVRIVLLLIVMGIILITLSLINAKTPLLTNAGHHFSTFMRLQ